FFKQFIEKERAVSAAVYETTQSIQQSGYTLSLDLEEEGANLFLEEGDERILLKRQGEDWLGKNEEVYLKTEELLTIAENDPGRLSNNVITRPMMQELLFPTLAFMAGDGEISYWAVLKKAFKQLDDRIKVPPVVPRLSWTL